MGKDISWPFLMARKPQELITTGNPSEEEMEVYGELVQMLDGRSPSSIIKDTKHDGKKAIEILRDHHLGKSMPRILSLQTKLTEDVTDSSNCSRQQVK